MNKKSPLHIQDIALLFNNLSTLLNSGIHLLTALDLIKTIISKHHSLVFILENLIADIQNGLSLTQALKKHPDFGTTTTELVSLGEQSGKLELTLERIATQCEKKLQIRQKIKKILFYPCITLIIAAVITIILLIFVIPQFEQLFNDLGGKLPWLTQAVIHLSENLRNHYPYLLILPILSILILEYFRNAPRYIKIYSDHFLLRIPIYGTLLKKKFFGDFAQNLEIELNSGIPLLKAIELNIPIFPNLVFQQLLALVHMNINQGSSFRISLAKTSFFPQLFIQMVAIGEESGTLSRMLQECAHWYEKELSEMIANIHQWIEPFIIITLGIIIGTLVISMYLPIFKLGTII